jgi:hypothetical protein
MLQHLRVVILASLALLYAASADIHSLPQESEPQSAATVEIEAEDPNDAIEAMIERKLWLVEESMAYALHRITGISGDEAREIVFLSHTEAVGYEDVNLFTILGVVIVESYGDPQALSHAGARGLMQIMPATGHFINASFPEEPWEGKQMLYDLETNIRYGVWYLDHLQQTFPDDDEAVLVAYNWGPGNVQQQQRAQRALPSEYPEKVREASDKIRRMANEYYNAHYWRSIDLNRDPPRFQDDPAESPNRSGPNKLLVDDGKGELLRERSRVQQVSGLLLGGDRPIPGRWEAPAWGNHRRVGWGHRSGDGGVHERASPRVCA